jgi:hypothetical protein
MVPGRIVSALLVAAALAIATRTASGELTIGAVLTDPRRYDGHRVVLSGTVTKLKSHTMRQGTAIHMFKLSDGTQSIKVLAIGEPPCPSGTAATVEGWIAVRQGRTRARVLIEATAVRCP